MMPTTKPASKPPTFTFTVRWSATTAGLQASREGTPATQEDATAQPIVEWSAPQKGAQHCLIVWDPDAPSASRAYLHWLVTNITGSSPSQGDTIVTWAPPTPPPGTGTHRYFFGLFQQTYPLSVHVVDRPLFNPVRFAELNGLRPLDVQWITIQADSVA